MALARWASKNLGLVHRAVYSYSSKSLASLSQTQGLSETSVTSSTKQRERLLTSRLYSSASTTDEKSDDVAVSEEETGKKSGKQRGRRPRGITLWRNKRGDHLVPSLHDLFPSNLGQALMQATENINKLLHNFTPSRLIGRMKEKDDRYKVRFHLPGLTKEDVKITIEDGILKIVGEHKEEEDETESDEDEDWASSRRFYGYYDTTLVLPEDAKADEIKAEMKDGLLTLIIPKSQSVKKDVKEVKVL